MSPQSDTPDRSDDSHQSPAAHGVTTVAPEQRSRRDLIITASIAAVVVVWILGTWGFSTARQADLHTTEPVAAEAAMQAIPQNLSEAWHRPSIDGELHVTKPLVQGPAVLLSDTHGVKGLDPKTGDVLWSYERNNELCSLTTAWGEAVPVFRGPEGCGEVVALKADSGQYSHTRSAISSDAVVPVSSNDYVGTVSRDRVELWRNDLVRTIEYGAVEAPQEPLYQPHAECHIHSALARKELLAIVETCPTEPETEGRAHVRLVKTVPEDSRKPEGLKDFKLGAENAQIVAIGQEAAVIYVAEKQPHLDVVTKDGKVSSSNPVPESPAIAEHSGDDPLPYMPAVADGPHHMYWWDGQRLHAFTPGKMSLDFTVENTLGTGAVIGDDLLAPTKDGIAVINTSTHETTRVIKVTRDPSVNSVSLAIAGNTIVERRQSGDKVELVGLRPS